jgi:hypothetical protein
VRRGEWKVESGEWRVGIKKIEIIKIKTNEKII